MAFFSVHIGTKSNTRPICSIFKPNCLINKDKHPVKFYEVWMKKYVNGNVRTQNRAINVYGGYIQIRICSKFGMDCFDSVKNKYKIR